MACFELCSPGCGNGEVFKSLFLYCTEQKQLDVTWLFRQSTDSNPESVIYPLIPVSYSPFNTQAESLSNISGSLDFTQNGPTQMNCLV